MKRGSATADPALLATVRAAMRSSERHAKQLQDLREALLDGDIQRVLTLARLVTGIEEEDEEGDRAAAGLH